MGIAEGDNQKPRLLHCPRCKYDTINDKANPICPLCKGRMLTVTFSALNGERMTSKPTVEIPLWQEIKK